MNSLMPRYYERGGGEGDNEVHPYLCDEAWGQAGCSLGTYEKDSTMTEWKFRGYDAVGDKGWVYGDLTHNQKVTATGLEPRVMVAGYEVYPESVGICTGCKDNANHMLYEGDICRVETPTGSFYTEIRYVAEHMRFYFYIDDGNALDFIEHVGLSFKKGNVFENKELLKK